MLLLLLVVAITTATTANSTVRISATTMSTLSPHLTELNSTTIQLSILLPPAFFSSGVKILNLEINIVGIN